MIPERAPIGDSFTGVVIEAGELKALAGEPQPGAATVASGSFVVRYAVQFLGKPHMAIVPGLLALDYGEMLTGEDAWTFLLERSNLHPRADVVGYRNDGSDEMVTVKLLDMAAPIQAYVYENDTGTTPLTRVHAVIGDVTVPARLLDYVKRYDSVERWQATL